MKAALICLWAVSVPFSWGHLARLNGQLVRPSDIIFIILSLFVIAKMKIAISRSGKVVLIALVGLLVAVATSSVLSGSSLNSLARLATVIIAPFVLADAIKSENFRINPVSMWLSALLFGVSSVAIIGLAVEVAQTALGGNINATIFKFFNGVFQINPFGPQGFEVRGVSYRNSLAAGLIALLSFVYAFLEKSKTRTVMIAICMLLVAASMSRSGWAAALVFTMLVMLQNKVRGVAIVAFIAVSVPLFFYSSTSAVFLDRVNSDIGRFSDYPGALEVLDENFFLGDAKRLDGVDGVIVHNVPLALGANYGLFAMLFFVLALLVFLYWFVKFTTLCVAREDKIYVAAGACAFLVFMRPLISGAGASLFSIGEWFALGLVLAASLKDSSKFRL